MEQKPHLPITMVTNHYGYLRQTYPGLGKSSAVYAICKGGLYSAMRPVTIALNEREAVDTCRQLEMAEYSNWHRKQT